MFYKVLKDNKVIDVLQGLIYLKYQPKNKIWVLCDESEAQAILSSSGNTIWHEQSLYEIPIDGYDTVMVEPIDQYEFHRLKMLNLSTPEQIVDAVLLDLINREVI